MTELQIPSEYVHPGELAAFPANSNTHSPQNIDELAASRKKFTQYKNAVVWAPKKEMTIILKNGNEATLKPGVRYVIAGEGLWRASKKRLDSTFEIKDFSHLPYDEALLLAENDNASALGSKIDPVQMMANLDRARHLHENDERLTAILDRAREQAGAVEGNGGEPGEPAEAQTDRADELQEKWQVKPGDLWTIGPHRLLCGDCREAGDVERLLGGERPAIEIHDPPYGARLNTDWSAAKSRLDLAAENALFGGKKYAPVIGDDQDFDPTFLFDRKLPKEMFLWGADYYSDKIPGKADGSWIVWDKRLDESADKMYGSCFELCWSLKRHKRDIIRVKWVGVFGIEQEPDRQRFHPTQKPVSVYKWILSRYSKENDISADFFLGAGSHLLAAHQLNRRCFGIELHPPYVSVCLQRLQDSGLSPKREA